MSLSLGDFTSLVCVSGSPSEGKDQRSQQVGRQRLGVMSAVAFQDLPLNIYMVIFGTGVFVFVLSLIFCCYFISADSFYTLQPLSLAPGFYLFLSRLLPLSFSPSQQTCAVCLEDFRVKDELGVNEGRKKDSQSQTLGLKLPSQPSVTDRKRGYLLRENFR
ncbi:unnamed protein product [Coregonus sp. 'balchen']|nr:unnamed protein product [Coregonus sp. 'balchen']